MSGTRELPGTRGSVAYGGIACIEIMTEWVK